MNCKLWTVNSLPERHIVTSQVEHSSVLNYCMALSSGGFTPAFRSGEFTSPRGGVKPPLHEPGYRVTYLPVDRLLDLKNDITLSSLLRAAAMVGRRESIELV